MSIIDSILVLMNRQGKKQKELTDYLGIDKSTFSQWKNGTLNSYNKYLDKIASFLGMSHAELIAFHEVNTPFMTGNNNFTEPNSSYKMNSRKENDTAESNSYKKSENKKEPPSKSAENGKTEKYLNISNMPVKEKEMLELFVRFLRWLDTQPDNPLAKDSE